MGSFLRFNVTGLMLSYQFGVLGSIDCTGFHDICRILSVRGSDGTTSGGAFGWMLLVFSSMRLGGLSVS